MTAIAERDLAQPVAAGAHLEELSIDLVDVGDNVRIDPGELEGLAATIREHGVIQAVGAVGPDAAGRYSLVFGQRRLLASKLAGRTTIPTIVRSSAEAGKPGATRSLEQLIENLERADLNPIDEARALQAILDADPKLTQAELATRLGRSAPWIANTLALLRAPREIQAHVAGGKLTAAHARALGGLVAKDQVRRAKEAIDRGMSAHGLEEQVKYQRQQAEREVTDRKKLEKAAATAVEKLHDADYPAGKTVYMDSWGTDTTVFQKGVQDAGWKFSTQHVWGRPGGGVCDCTARKISFVSWQGNVTVSTVCSDSKHVNSKEQADAAKRNEKAKAQAARRSQLKAAVHAWFAAKPVDATVARLALWVLMGDYARGEFAKRRLPNVKKPDAWAALVSMPDKAAIEDLVDRLISGTTSWQDDAPLDSMLASFGVELPPAPAKAAKAKKAAAKP